MKIHSVYVNKKFISGNLKGITVEDHHFYDIPESDIPDTDEYMQRLIETCQSIKTLGGSTYIITHYEIRKGSI